MDLELNTFQHRQGTAGLLFEYIYLLRYKRLPEVWEWTLGWALITGALVVVRPVEAMPLVAIHAAARDVQRALGLVENAS